MRYGVAHVSGYVNTVWYRVVDLPLGINQELLDTINFTTAKCQKKDYYNELIVDKLIKIITLSCQFGELYLAGTCWPRAFICCLCVGLLF